MDKDEVRYTKGDYKRLSNRIRTNPKEISNEDYEMLQALRLTYKEPLAIVFDSLYKIAHKVNENSICTYRIKRIESIISKLIRFKDMEVQRASDIAGCRCIMPTNEDAIRLIELIKKQEQHLPFFIKGENDYITKPKENGYRSVHLNVQMKDESKKVIEIQIRSLEQHNWATLVEISDVLFSSQLKEYNDKVNPELYRFHQILAKNDIELTLEDKRLLAEISGKYRYLEKLGNVFNQNSIDLRSLRNKLKMSRVSYFLISTGSDGKPELQAFEYFDEAEREYFNMFSNNPDNKNIVLTHLNKTSFEKLSIAYSNYFLTYNATLFRILKAISDITIYAYNHYRFIEFKKNYRAFWIISITWFGKKLEEADIFNKDVNVRKSIKKKKEWFVSIASSLQIVNSIINNMQKGFHSNFLYIVMKYYKGRIDKELMTDLIREKA